MDLSKIPENQLCRKIYWQFKRLLKDPNPKFGAGPAGVDWFTWDGFVTGPPDTPYEGGLFLLTIRFPPEYPFVPLKVLFKTRIFHPNIASDGSIQLAMFSDRWSPGNSVSIVLENLWELLRKPKLEESLNKAHIELYANNRMEYDSIARSFTTMYG